jgi:nitroreductase
VLEECLELAQQAPTAGYSQNWHFVVVEDAEKRKALAEIWREIALPYLQRGGGAREGQSLLISEAVVHLADHMHEVPVFVIPCVQGRYEGKPNALVASMYASIIPAAWSFMLAARSRGLGTVWTTFHLMHEREVAEILGIPYDDVTQIALIPVAYSLGTDFKPGSASARLDGALGAWPPSTPHGAPAYWRRDADPSRALLLHGRHDARSVVRESHVRHAHR